MLVLPLAVFARSHNLKVHVDSVHCGVRAHVCPEDGCPKSFGRRHDLLRHIQSKHTNLGSPRRKLFAKNVATKTGAKAEAI